MILAPNCIRHSVNKEEKLENVLVQTLGGKKGI